MIICYGCRLLLAILPEILGGRWWGLNEETWPVKAWDFPMGVSATVPARLGALYLHLGSELYGRIPLHASLMIKGPKLYIKGWDLIVLYITGQEISGITPTFYDEGLSMRAKVKGTCGQSLALVREAISRRCFQVLQSQEVFHTLGLATATSCGYAGYVGSSLLLAWFF